MPLLPPGFVPGVPLGFVPGVLLGSSLGFIVEPVVVEVGLLCALFNCNLPLTVILIFDEILFTEIENLLTSGTGLQSYVPLSFLLTLSQDSLLR